jgi:hypothetical protein
MLAYVFWHHPLASADVSGYERSLLALHERLKASGAVLDSVTYRVDGMPWVNEGGAGYEDWYLVGGWPELGALNTSAVSADRKPPHDDAAKAYAAGAGAVYELRSGSAGLRGSPVAQWLAKPRGMSYAAFDGALAGCGGGLWRRQMVLGPGTEFCLTAADPIVLPSTLQDRAVARTLLAGEPQSLN